jgi:hypothetical protein
MSLSNGYRNIAAIGGAALAAAITVVALAFATTHGDPPVDVAGGSIHGVARPSHIWHEEVGSSGQSYSIANTGDNEQIVITDVNKQIFLNCTASQWVVSFSMNEKSAPAAKFCTNNECDEQKPVDGDGKLYLTTAYGSNKKWKHTWGVKWWNIEHQDGNNIQITSLVLKTAGSRIGSNSCPASWAHSFSDHKWHVRIGKSEP